MSRLRRYQPLEEIGRGTWGIVYLGRVQPSDERIAIKIAHGTQPDQLRSLKDEFRRARGLRHPNLVRLFTLDSGEAEVFFTMEFVPGWDLDRLPDDVALDRVAIARQLVAAVAYLHAHDLVHRDLKPSNVRVTPDGRVVVLDFGLSTSTRRSLEDRGTMVGTADYLAPECLYGAPHSPSSDAYSLGLLLWLVFGGAHPFSGVPVHERLHRGPGPLPAGVGELGVDMAALLDPSPEKRPAVLDVAERQQLSSPAQVQFVGRREEVARLRDAILPHRAGVVHVLGPSGIGKTRLVREALSPHHSDMRIVATRCHFDESVPFRAVDGLVDELVAVIGELEDGLSPQERRWLGAVFPVLRSSGETTSAADSAAASPRERRLGAARALARLVAAISEQIDLVLWVDDLQWGDADSRPFLEALVSRPSCPIILSYRWPESGAELVEALREAAEGSFEVDVGPLEPEAARELARALDAPDPTTVAEHARGLPIWLAELAQGFLPSRGLASLAATLRARFESLAVGERRLLELILLGKTLEPDLVLAACSDLEPLHGIDKLEREHWLRRTPGGNLECWHDTIAEALGPCFTEASRRSGHGLIADQLARLSRRPPRRLARHLEGAGRDAQAAATYCEAAREASAQLAFEQAARDYRDAVRLSSEPSRALLVAAAEAEDLAGHSEAAGRRFLAASELPDDGVSGPGHELRLKGGTRLLYAGQLEQGRAPLEALLAEVGVPSLDHPLRVALLNRIRLLWTGVDVRRGRREPRQRETRRAKTLVDTAGALFMLDPVLADALAVRGLREALAVGDVETAVKGLGFECSSQANFGGPFFSKKARGLLEELRALAQERGDDFSQASFRLTEGSLAFFSNDWDTAAVASHEAYRRFVERVPGTAHYRNAAVAFHVGALGASGRIRELGEVLPEYREVAAARGDRYAEVSLATGETFFVDLAADVPDRALARADGAIERWPAREFGSPHYQHAYLRVSCLLYKGQATAAWEALDSVWPTLESKGFTRLDWLGNQLRYLRVRAAFWRGAKSAGLLRDVRRQLRKLSKSRLPAVRAFALATQSAVAGHRDPTMAQAGVDAFEAAGMPLHALALGEVTGCRPGFEEAASFEGVRDPGSLLPVLVPCAL